MLSKDIETSVNKQLKTMFADKPYKLFITSFSGS